MRKLLPLLLIGFFLQEEVKAQCNAAFNASINGATVHLQAVDSTTSLIHNWKFGDSTQGWGVHASHTYSLPGTYVVKHFVFDSLNNCRDSAQQVITISFSPSCSASFVAQRDSLNRYDFYSNSNAGGSIISYKWKVNDSLVSTASAFSTWLQPGANLVCLTIKTNAGCTSSVCDSIWVDTIAHCNLTANFTATADSLNPGKFSFTPSPLTPGSSYSWIFGDGQTSSSPTPLHTYSNPGTYTVLLTIADSTGGCSDSVFKHIVIQAPGPDSCTATFTYTTNPSQPRQLTFMAISNEPIVSQSWFIRPCDSTNIPSPDSVYYNTANPVHTFSAPGCYQVCLQIRTNTGCRKTYCNTVMINNTDSTGDSTVIQRITFYPNPAHGASIHMQLKLEQPAKVKLAVFNSYGNIVYTGERNYVAGNNKISIPVDNLQRGIYYVDLQFGSIRKRSVFQKL